MESGARAAVEQRVSFATRLAGPTSIRPMHRTTLAATTALLVAFQGCSASGVEAPQEGRAESVPQLLAPGILSTRMGEYSPTLDVERGELVFMRRTPGEFDYTLYSSRRVDGAWIAPVPLPFSGEWRDGGASFVPDGSALLFDSRRPAEGLDERSINVWRVARSEDGGADSGRAGWEEPELVRLASEGPSSEDGDQADEFGPFEDSGGNVYFYSFRKPDRGGRHYVLEPGATRVRHENALPDPSADTFVGYATVSADGDLAVIEGRAVGRRDTDLFLYRRDERGRWGAAIELPSVNTRWGEGTPFLTADGTTLVFASTRPSGDERTAVSNLYTIDVAALVEASEARDR